MKVFQVNNIIESSVGAGIHQSCMMYQPPTQTSATPTAMVPDTGEYSRLEAGYMYATPELVYEKPEEHYDDYSHLHRLY